MRNLRRLVAEPSDSVLVQAPRALVASVLAAALDMGLLVAQVELLGFSPTIACVLSYLVGAALQYVLCLTWVFPSRGAPTGFGAFVAFSLVGLGITWMTLRVLGDALSVPYVGAKVCALGLAFAWNFLSRKLILFRTPTELATDDLRDASPAVAYAARPSSVREPVAAPR